jgi:hypothetical protein
MPEPGLIPEHVLLLPRGKIGESFVACGTLESVYAIAVHTGEPDKGFFQLFTAHAFHRIAPKALDVSN